MIFKACEIYGTNTDRQTMCENCKKKSKQDKKKGRIFCFFFKQRIKG